MKSSGETPHPRTHLFVVRVWLENIGDAKAEWRGDVKQVLSGEVRHFREWITLIEHLKDMLAGSESNGTA